MENQVSNKVATSISLTKPEKLLETTQKLFLRFKLIWGQRWTKSIDEISLAIAFDEWSGALKHLSVEQVDEAVEFCKLNLEWPPTIAEFLSVVEKQNGVPSVDEVIQSAIRREFNHILIKRIFDEVGSWAFSHDTEKDLRDKVERVYQKQISNFRLSLRKGEI